nr:hypothetical protein [Tanacetum cinerariifolium]
MLSLREKIKLDLEVRLMGEALILSRSLDPLYGDYIDLNEPLELRRNQVDDLEPTIEEGKVINETIMDIVKTRCNDEKIDILDKYPSYCDFDRKIHIDCAYNLQFSCMIGYEYINANFFPLLSINVMSKRFYNSIIKDNVEYKRKNIVGAFINVPIIVGKFSTVTDFAAVENMDAYRDDEMGDIIWRERFMNSFEEKTDGKAMLNSIQNGDHPFPVVAQVSLAGTTPNAIPTLKDPNETAKDIWDALERQMRGSEYGEQDRKVAILYEYDTFKATEGKKCGYKKDNCELNYKFLNNLQPKWKQYGTLMRQTKNLMDINIDALYNILKQNQGDAGYKKKAVVVTSDPLALVAEKIKKFYAKPTNNNLRTSSASSSSSNNKPEYLKSVKKKEDKKVDEKKRDMTKVKCYNYKKEGHFAKDCKKAKVKDYNYYKTKMLLAKKDNDKQVLLAEDQAWMEFSSDSYQEINANIVFMAKMEKGLSDSDESSSSAEETIAE